MDHTHGDIGEHLLLQYLSGNADETLKQRVQQWMDADPRNRAAVDRLETLWSETGKLQPRPVAVDVDAAWEKVAARIGRSESSGVNALPLVISMRTRNWYLAAAAAAILLLAGFFALYQPWNPNGGNREIASLDNVVHDTLPDGTKIVLSHGSRVTFPEKFGTTTREVKMSGNVFFVVTTDRTHPFLIHAGPAAIRVLGTSFSVHSSGEMAEVSVAEGSVLFFSPSGGMADSASVVLHAGQRARLQTGDTRPLLLTQPEPDDHYWADRSLDFRGQSLNEVFSLLEKYYHVKIVPSNASILGCRLTASFCDEPIEQVLTVISESFGLRMQRQGQEFYLTGDGCSTGNQ